MTRNVVTRALVVFSGALVALAGVLPIPAQAATTALVDPDGATSSVTVRGRTLVDAGEVVDDVWIVSGAASIKGHVTGSVVVLNGSVGVSGTVDGDVLVVRGGVWVGPEGSVGGDIDASRDVTLTDGSIVVGATSEGSVLDGLQALAARVRTAMWIGLTIALLAIGLLFAWLAPSALDRARASLVDRPFGAGLRGMIVLAVLPALALVTFAAVTGGFVGVLLASATALLALAGTAVAATAIGRLVLGADRIVSSFLLGALGLRIVALVPFVGDAVAIGAAVVGTGAIVQALRQQAAPAAGAADREEPADPDPIVAPSLLGPNDHDLRVVGPDPDERFARSTAGAGWLDSVLHGPGPAGPTRLDLRDADPLIDLRGESAPATTSAPRPGIQLFRTPVAAAADADAPQVIASLPVREDNFADDPGAAPGNGHRTPLFAAGPAATRHHGVPLFTETPTSARVTVPGLFRDGPAPDPSPGAPAGPDTGARPADDTRMPSASVLDSLANLWDTTDARRSRGGSGAVDVRDRLFVDGPAVGESTTAGGIFADGSRVWRPGRN